MFTMVWDIPGGAHTLVDDSSIELVHRGRFGLRLLFPYFLQKDGWLNGGILFLGVRSYRWSTTRLIPADSFGQGHIFNALGVDNESPWVRQLRAAAREQNASIGDLKHYAIFLHDYGLFEVAAQSFEVIEATVRGSPG